MCRFILFNTKGKTNAGKILKDFAYMCEHSKNYQGDGWGIVYEENGKLFRRRSLKPIWEDVKNFYLPKTYFFLAHARFAHGKWTLNDIENNQPFYKENYVFVFNGELKRVDIDIPGRIGAEKVFNLVLEKIKKENVEKGIREAVSIMEKKSARVKAINFLLLKGKDCYANCRYAVDPDYFDLRLHLSSEKLIIVSEPISNGSTTLTISPERSRRANINFERIKDKEIRKIYLFQDVSLFSPIEDV